jgi:hypothetical protein
MWDVVDIWQELIIKLEGARPTFFLFSARLHPGAPNFFRVDLDG